MKNDCCCFKGCIRRCVILENAKNKDHIKFVVKCEKEYWRFENLKNKYLRVHAITLSENEDEHDVYRDSFGSFAIIRPVKKIRKIEFEFKDVRSKYVLDKGEARNRDELRILMTHFFNKYKNHDDKDDIFFYVRENGEQIMSGMIYTKESPFGYEAMLRAIERV